MGKSRTRDFYSRLILRIRVVLLGRIRIRIFFDGWFRFISNRTRNHSFIYPDNISFKTKRNTVLNISKATVLQKYQCIQVFGPWKNCKYTANYKRDQLREEEKMCPSPSLRYCMIVLLSMAAATFYIKKFELKEMTWQKFEEKFCPQRIMRNINHVNALHVPIAETTP